MDGILPQPPIVAPHPPGVGNDGADRLSFRRVLAALRGDALAAFPDAAFDEPVVVQRFLGHRYIIENRPEAISRVLIDNGDNYPRSTAAFRVLRPLLGNGLFLSAGDAWRRQRRFTATAFSPRSIHLLAGQIASAAELLVEQLGAVEGPIDLVPVLRRFALEIIGTTMFSLDMEKYGAQLRDLILHYAARLGSPTLADLLLPSGAPTPTELGRRRFRRRWRELIEQIVAERQVCDDRDRAPDLFDLLAEQTRHCSDRAELADQLATLMVAGHETTAAAMFWSLYLLARHSDKQERLAAEVANFDFGATIADTLLPRLVYCRAVVDEVLRLYPPAFVIVRQAIEDDLIGGIVVPRGTLVLIAPWILHRHRRLWTDPDTFDPGRFLLGKQRPNRFAYLPFGIGPRVCIGASFAITELQLMLATLIRAFSIELTDDRPVFPTAMVSLQPARQPLFRLMPRMSK
jgi:cytochrome P450